MNWKTIFAVGLAGVGLYLLSKKKATATTDATKKTATTKTPTASAPTISTPTITYTGTTESKKKLTNPADNTWYPAADFLPPVSGVFSKAALKTCGFAGTGCYWRKLSSGSYEVCSCSSGACDDYAFRDFWGLI